MQLARGGCSWSHSLCMWRLSVHMVMLCVQHSSRLFLLRVPSCQLAMRLTYLLPFAYTCRQVRLDTNVHHRWRCNCTRCRRTSAVFVTDISDVQAGVCVSQRQLLGGRSKIRIPHLSNIPHIRCKHYVGTVIFTTIKSHSLA